MVDGQRESTALELLNEIARVATEGLDLRPLLQRITDRLVHSLDWDHAGFALIDGARGEFTVEAVTSRVTTQIEIGLRRALGAGIVGVVSATGRPVAVNEVENHPEYVALTEGVQTEVCLPLVRGGEVIAVLNLEDRRRRNLTEELPLLESIARQVAGAIANARLHSEVSRRAQQLELLAELLHAALDEEELELVLARIASRLRERFELLLAAVYLVDPYSSRLDLKALSTAEAEPAFRAPLTLSVSRGIIGRSLQLGRAQLVLDARSDPDYVQVAPEVVAELAIPIRFRGRSLGVINFETDRPQIFTQEAVSLLQLVCVQLAGVVHLAALNQKMSETSGELEQTNQRLREMNRTLMELSTVDSLTGIANRRHFDRTLDLEWRRAVRSTLPVSLLFIDIDHFKTYNDSYGHLRGDAVLADVAKILAVSFTRAGDFVARYGGEEFAVLLPNTTEDSAVELAELARARVEARAISHLASPSGKVLTVSIGVASIAVEPRLLPATILEAADRALYRAKAQGRNCVRVAGRDEETRAGAD